MQDHDDAIIHKALQVIRHHLASGGRIGKFDGGSIRSFLQNIRQNGFKDFGQNIKPTPLPVPPPSPAPVTMPSLPAPTFNNFSPAIMPAGMGGGNPPPSGGLNAAGPQPFAMAQMPSMGGGGGGSMGASSPAMAPAPHARGGRAGFDDGGAIDDRLKYLLEHGGIDSNAQTFDSLPAPSPSLPGGIESTPNSGPSASTPGNVGGASTPGNAGGAGTSGSVGSASAPGADPTGGATLGAGPGRGGNDASVAADPTGGATLGAGPGKGGNDTSANPTGGAALGAGPGKGGNDVSIATDPNSIPGLNNIFGPLQPDLPAYPVIPVEKYDLPAPPPDPIVDDKTALNPYEDLPSTPEAPAAPAAPVVSAPVENTPEESASAISPSIGPYGALVDPTDLSPVTNNQVSPLSTMKDESRAQNIYTGPIYADAPAPNVGPRSAMYENMDEMMSALNADPNAESAPGTMEGSVEGSMAGSMEGSAEGGYGGGNSGGGSYGNGDEGGGSTGNGSQGSSEGGESGGGSEGGGSSGGGSEGGGSSGGGGGGGGEEKRGGRIAKHHYIPQEDPIVKKALMLVSKKATSRPGRRI